MGFRTGRTATLSAVAALCLVGAASGGRTAPQVESPSGDALSLLLKKQTQAFSDAGIHGDAATLARYLDPDVVFTNEDGAKVTKTLIVNGASPSAGQPHIQVTEWALVPQGNVATATFIDVLTQTSGDRQLVYRYHSTEVWAKRQDGWKMIASQTMVVPQDPPEMALPSAQLDEYVGRYEAGPTLKIEIVRTGGSLASRLNDGTLRPLKVELRDVLFTPGTAPGRRLFQRDADGRITGYIARRDGNDQIFRKVV